jgi:hypothetical protein
MIEKQEFMHGAALVRLLEDARCRNVRRVDLGYEVNGQALVFLKYSTKSHSPWRFGFSAEERRKLAASGETFLVAIALICGGDGICAVTLAEAESIMGADAGWIAVRRRFHELYGVSGQAGTLPRKVPLHRWPAILFDGVGDGGSTN